MSIGLVARSNWANPGNHGRRLRKTVDAVQWQLQKRLTGSFRQLRLPNGMLFNAHPDCVVSSALIYSDWPEYNELAFLRRTLRPGDVVINVGANVGHISLLLADLVRAEDIFAFEPAPGAFRRLQENWVLNGFPTERLAQLAVGRTSGNVFIEADSRPTTTLQVSGVEDPRRRVRVSMVSLDERRRSWANRTVGLLKVDVEGYEPEVFEGSLAVLAEDRPRLIMFESLAGKVDERVSRILAAQRYTLFQLDERGQPVADRSTAQNLFAMPAELCPAQSATA